MALMAFTCALFDKKEKHKIKLLFAAFLAICAALFMNPFGLKAITYPFTIFTNYGYRLVENQTIAFLINYGMRMPNLALYWIVAGIFLIAFIFSLHQRKKYPSPMRAADIFFGELLASD